MSQAIQPNIKPAARNGLAPLTRGEIMQRHDTRIDMEFFERMQEEAELQLMRRERPSREVRLSDDY